MASGAAERYFSQVANDVLQATERLTQHLEENLSVLWGSKPTELPKDHVEDKDLLQQNPLHGMAENVLHGIFDQQVLLFFVDIFNCLMAKLMIVVGQAKPRTMMESLHAFRSAITWSEPFIISLLLFQVIMFLLCIYVSKYNPHLAPRLGIMVFIAILVKGSEYMNQYGSDHWESFCTQNYFDAQGVFMSMMICAPLLVDSFIMLCFYLRETSQLLIQFKKLQLKQQQKQRRNPNAAKTTTSTTAASSGTPIARRLKKEDWSNDKGSNTRAI